MQRFTIKKGATSQILPVSVYDSSSTVGAKLSGLVFNTASLTAYYNRMGAAGAATAITLATATKGTWATGGFVAVDGTNMPGDYELHIPDAAIASGVDRVIVQLKGAANMVPVNLEIDLIAVDLQDTVRAGLTSLPNAVVNAAGGLVTSAGGATGIDDLATPTNITAGTIANVTNAVTLPAIPSNWITAAGIAASAMNGKGDWNIGKTGYALTQAFPTNFADLAITVTTGEIALPSIPANWITAAGINAAALDGKGNWNIGKTGYTVSTVSDKTGYSLTQTFPTNFADLAIAVTTGEISLPTIPANWITAAGINASALNGKGDWNIGKTGYSLTQAFPSNFADLAITASTGLVTVGTNNDKTGYTASTVSDKTGYSISGTKTTLDALNDINAAAVNSEVVDALDVDTITLPGQAAMPATPTHRQAIAWLYKFLRNEKRSTATTISLYNDAGTVVDAKRTISDDGTTYTEEEVVSGP